MTVRGGTPPTADRRRRTSCVWMAIAAFALIINGITVTVLLASDGASAKTTGVNGVFDNPRASSAVHAAEEHVLGVVSLDADSGDPEISELAEQTTAKFRTDFEQFAENYLDEVRTEGLQVTARVTAAGVSAMTVDRATVIVATSGESVDTAYPEPRARDFQLRVVVTWIDDDWRIDDLEFL